VQEAEQIFTESWWPRRF